MRTDHSSLAWLFRFKSPQGQLARWLEEFCQYSFTIQHRAGKSHNNADALSRIQENVCDCYQAGSSVASLPCEGCKHCVKVHEQWARFEEDVDDVVPLATRRVSREETDKSCDSVVCNWLEGISQEEMKRAQKVDKDVSIVYHWVEDAVKPSLSEFVNIEIYVLQNNFSAPYAHFEKIISHQ